MIGYRLYCSTDYQIMIDPWAKVDERSPLSEVLGMGEYELVLSECVWEVED